MIYINDIPSFRDPEYYKVIPDDRIEKIEIINSVAIQDYGHVEAGDTISLTCLFSEKNFNELLKLWESREKVSFKDTTGVVRQGMIIVMKEYEPDKNFPKYTLATFELWRKKMANPYINVYMNNPTAGETDGTPVSTDGENTAPISFVLDASQNESQTLKLAIRTEAGYVTTGTTTISDQNDTNDRLKLCWTEDGEFKDSISTAESITSVNTIFYAKASSAETENPQTDRSASFKVNCVIASV